MKKVTDFIKPNILIIFGALLLLTYLNFLSLQGAYLAIGIIGVISASYYLAIGILELLLQNKLPRKIFDIISACLFPIFMFVIFLINIINGADNLLPTGWIILILSMIGSITMPAFYIVGKLVNKGFLLRMAYLFAAIFALILLLNVLYGQQGFIQNGAPNTLGAIDLMMLVIYVAFISYLFGSLGKAEEPQKVEEKAEEPKEEPAPEEQPEQPAEENKEEQPQE